MSLSKMEASRNRVPVIEDAALTSDTDSGILQPVLVEDVLSEQELQQLSEEAQVLEKQLGISSSGFPPSSRSLKGYTLDSTLIANTVSLPVRALYQAGLLNPTMTNITEGTGLAAHVVTLYRAEFTDRNRSFDITEETYRAMVNGVEPHNEEIDEDAILLVQASVDPTVADRGSSRESSVDGRGNTKPFNEDTRFPARTRDV